MINWFFRRSNKEKIQLLFSKYVPKELVNLTDSASTLKLNELSEGSVEYIFALVYCPTANETAQMLGNLASIAERGGWMVQTMLCNLVVIVHGTLPSATPTVSRLALTNQLLVTFTTQVKVIHGTQLASYGSMGSNARVTYGLLLPAFTEILSALNALSFGQVGEFHG